MNPPEVVMADFQTEISRDYTTIIVVISCLSREGLDDYIEDDFPNELVSIILS